MRFAAYPLEYLVAPCEGIGVYGSCPRFLPRCHDATSRSRPELARVSAAVDEAAAALAQRLRAADATGGCAAVCCWGVAAAGLARLCEHEQEAGAPMGTAAVLTAAGWAVWAARRPCKPSAALGRPLRALSWTGCLNVRGHVAA